MYKLEISGDGEIKLEFDNEIRTDILDLIIKNRNNQVLDSESNADTQDDYDVSDEVLAQAETLAKVTKPKKRTVKIYSNHRSRADFKNKIFFGIKHKLTFPQLLTLYNDLNWGCNSIGRAVGSDSETVRRVLSKLTKMRGMSDRFHCNKGDIPESVIINLINS